MLHRDAGRLTLAGPCPAIDSADPGPAGFVGSVIVADFDSLQDARAWADADPYVAAGVYARVDILPFKQSYARAAGYRFGDQTILGFSHTHFSGAGHSDLGDILLTPVVGEARLEPGQVDKPGSGYRSRYSHATEVAQPGYYAVTLSDSQVRAELTAGLRTGLHRYTFQKGERAQVLLLSASVGFASASARSAAASRGVGVRVGIGNGRGTAPVDAQAVATTATTTASVDDDAEASTAVDGDGDGNSCPRVHGDSKSGVGLRGAEQHYHD